MTLCGGFSDDKPITDEIKAILATHQADIDKAVGGPFKPATVKTQVVAGTNFLMTGTVHNEAVRVKIFRPLPHTNDPTQLVEAKKI